MPGRAGLLPVAGDVACALLTYTGPGPAYCDGFDAAGVLNTTGLSVLDGASRFSGTTVEATELAGLGGASGRTRLGICEGSVGGREVGVDGRDAVAELTEGDSGRLNGDDRCAPKDNGLGFFGEVALKGCCQIQQLKWYGYSQRTIMLTNTRPQSLLWYLKILQGE